MSEFSITKSGVLKSYNGKDSSVVIPEGVKKIGSMAFYMNSGIKSVTIPGCVTEIGESAFSNCKALKKVVVLSGKPISICDYAFVDCRKLTVVELPEKIKSISDTAFKGCDGLADEQGNIIIRGTLCSHIGTNTEVIIKDGIQSIAAEAFKWCDSVERIVIPEGVTSIGAYAFCGCSNLKTISIPDSVCNIGDFAFANCPKLADDNGFLIIRNSILSYTGSASDVVIPTGIEKIEPWAFRGCQSVVRITIPDSVTEIGKNAFYQCEQLTSVTLPAGLQKLATALFSGCISLTEVIIPNTVTEIMARAFYDCEAITKLAVPETVTAIGEDAFMSCEKLTQITLPEGLTELGNGAFKSCDSLKTVFIPKGVHSIGSDTFDRCSSLELIEAPEHLHKQIDGCYLKIEVKYYEDNVAGEQENVEADTESNDSIEVNRVVIKCKAEDFDAVRKLFEESLAHYYVAGACLGDALYEKVLAAIREDEDLCKIYTVDNAVCADIADGIDAGEQLAWKLLNKTSFRNEFGSMAIVGETIIKRFPYADFSLIHHMQDIGESFERIWTENGKIESEWME